MNLLHAPSDLCGLKEVVYDLTDYNGQDLINLVDELTNDLVMYHCMNREEDADACQIALTELMEYIVFIKGGIE